MNIENLVPPLELCKLIPKGEFEDSYAIYVYIYGWLLMPADDCASDIKEEHSYYPAPNVQEIMAELPSCVCCRINEEWSISLVNDRFENAIKDSNGATAALKLWLKLKGVDYENSNNQHKA